MTLRRSKRSPRQFFPHDPPALTLLQPSGLSMPGARVQIDAVLLCPG